MIKIEGKTITIKTGGRKKMMLGSCGRDTQMNRVYRAEHEAERLRPYSISTTPSGLVVGAVAVFTNQIMVHDHIRKMIGGGSLYVTVCGKSSAKPYAIMNRVVIPDSGNSVSVYDLIHEIAHVACNYGQDHGVEFCSIYLMIAKEMMPKRCYKALVDSYDKNKVKYNIIKEGENDESINIESVGKRRAKRIGFVAGVARRGRWIYRILIQRNGR